MSRRDRDRKPARQPPTLDPRRRLLIVCEGEVTEPEYFSQFQRWCRNPRVEVRVEGPRGVPLSLVTAAIALKDQANEAARRERDENPRYDEVWCVFDVDEHPKIPEARQLAQSNGLLLAMSHPCFELWLLLHLRDNPGPQDRHTLQSMLKALVPGPKAKHLDFDQLIGGYDEAYRRAERLRRDASDAGEPTRNPSTEVFLLTDSIDEAGAARRGAVQKGHDDKSRQKAQAAADAALAQAAREAGEEE